MARLVEGTEFRRKLRDRLGVQLQRSADITPDEYAENSRIATLQDPDTLAKNKDLREFAQRQAETDVPIDRLMDEAPSTAEAMSVDPALLGIARDDLPRQIELEKSQRELVGIKGWVEGISRSYNMGAHQTELSMLYGQELLDEFIPGEFVFTEEDRERREFLEANPPLETHRPTSALEDLIYLPHAIVQQVPNLAVNAMGRAAGGAAGFIGGVPGAVAGQHVGGQTASTLLVGGEAYQTLSQMPDVSPDVAKKLSVSIGIVGGALENLSLGRVGGNALKRLVGNRKFLQAARLYADSATTEGVTEAAQSALLSGGEIVAMLTRGETIESFEFTDRFTGESHRGLPALMLKALEEGYEGAKVGFGMTAAGRTASSATRNVTRMARSIARSERMTPVVKAVQQHAQASKLSERAPEEARKLARKQVADGSAPDKAYISKGKLREFFQDEDDPTPLDEIPGFREQLERGDDDLNADVEMDYEDYVAIFLRTQAGRALSDDVKFDPTGFTLNEIEQAKADLERMVDEARASMDEAEAQGLVFAPVRQAIDEQLAEAGIGTEQAEAIGDALAARLAMRSRETGREVRQIIADEGLPLIESRGQIIDVNERLTSLLGQEQTRTELETFRETGGEGQAELVERVGEEFTEVDDLVRFMLDEANAGEIVGALSPLADIAVTASDLAPLAEGKRGSVLIGDTVQGALIRLANASDGSTILHESGHIWLAQLEADAALEGASDQLKKDWKAVRAWIGLGEGASVLNHPEAQEKFARGVEQWLLEGQAPSVELEGAFAKFTAWLTRIYGSVKGRWFKGVGLDDPIRNVLERMLATDQQIMEAREARGLERPQLTVADGLTPERAARLALARQRARVRPEVDQRRRAARQTRKEAQENFKAARKRVRAEVERAVYRRKAWQVQYWLARGTMHPSIAEDQVPVGVKGLPSVKLDRESTLDLLTETQAEAFHPGRYGLVQKSGGLHPDIVAQAFGYDSTPQMLEEISQIGTAALRAAALDRLTDEAIARQQNTNQEAADALYDDVAKRGLEELMIELQSIGNLTGRRGTPSWILKAMAEVQAGRLKVRELTPARWRRQAWKAGMDVAKAQASGDFDQMQAALQRQVFMLHMEGEVRKRVKDRDRVRRRIRRHLKPHTQQNLLGRRGARYMKDAHNFILQQYGALPGTREPLSSESLRTYEVRIHDAGMDSRIPASVMAAAGQAPIAMQERTVNEMLDFEAAIKNIVHNARRFQEAVSEERKESRENRRADLHSDLAKRRGGKNLKVSTIPGHFRRWAGNVKAELAQMEFVVEDLGEGFREHVWRPVLFAEQEEQRLRDEFIRSFIEAFIDHRNENRRHNRHFVVPELASEYNPEGKFTTWELMVVVLNMGNASNMERLWQGFGWDQDGGPSQAEVRAIAAEHLSDADLAFINRTWEIVGALWPKIVAQEERISGVRPKEIIAETFQIRGVEMTGGYFPVIYDPQHVRFPDPVRDKASMGSLFDRLPEAARASTGHSWTKARGEPVGGPLSLSMQNVPNHLQNVVHDLSHRETLMDVWMLLDDKELQQVMYDKLGKAQTDYFKGWLQIQAATEASSQYMPGNFFEKSLRRIRLHNTVFYLGANVGTIGTQILGNLNAMGVGIRTYGLATYSQHYAASVVQNMRDWTAVREDIIEKSTFMKHRRRAVDLDLGSLSAEFAGFDSKLFNEAVDWGIRAIAEMQFHSVDRMQWKAVYNAEIAQGTPEPAAVLKADSFVRMTQGGGTRASAPPIQYNHEFLRAFIPFYTYTSTVLNRVAFDSSATAEALRAEWEAEGLSARAAAESAGRLTNLWLMQLVLPAMGYAAIRSIPGLFGRGPEDDESYFVWLMKQGLLGSLDVMAGFPLLRESQRALQDFDSTERAISTLPVLRTVALPVQTVIDTASAVESISEGDLRQASAELMTMAKSVAVFYRLPLNYPLTRLERFLEDEE